MKVELKKLDELGYVSRGRSRHRPRDATHLYGGPFPFIQTGDVKHAGLYLKNYTQTYSQAGLEQSRMWPVGTLCITIAANIADTSILGIEACFPDSIIGFIPDDDKTDARFVKYSFDALLKDQYRSFSQGVAQDNLSQEKLLSISLPIPLLEKQKRIADILSSYDDLIEANSRRIELLEESARLLYKEWFVDLGFPGHERVKIVDGRPEEWSSVSVPNAIEINPKETIDKTTSIRYIPMFALSESGMSINSSYMETRNESTSVKFKNGDTLLARITPCLENGKTGFVNLLEENEVACGSTEFIVMRGNFVSSFYTYCLARTYDFREKAIYSMTGSSGRQRVQVAALNDYFILVPPARLIRLFDEIAQKEFDQIRNLQQQNDRLSQARDLLLPKLMSGEIEI